MNEDLIYRLKKRAEIRRSISTRKSVQNNEPDRIADLLEEAAEKLRKYELRNIAQCDRIAILEAQVYGGTTK